MKVLITDIENLNLPVNGDMEIVSPSTGQAAAENSTQENRYVSIALPRWIYTICAHDGWKKKIKAAGGKVEDFRKNLGDNYGTSDI